MDFAVWGPFDAKTAKDRMFTAMVQVRPGVYAKVQMRGPSTYIEWEASWKVFKVTAVMLQLATPGALNAYAYGIRQLATEIFPDDWATIYRWDCEARDHHWQRLAERIRDGSHDPTRLGDIKFNPNVPWDYILQATRQGLPAGPITEWWANKINALHKDMNVRNKDDAQTHSDFQSALQAETSHGHGKGSKDRRVIKSKVKALQQNQTPTNPHANKFCDICGLQGHISMNCWHNPANQAPRAPSVVRKGGKGGKGGKHGKGGKGGKGSKGSKGGKGQSRW